MQPVEQANHNGWNQSSQMIRQYLLVKAEASISIFNNCDRTYEN